MSEPATWQKASARGCKRRPQSNLSHTQDETKGNELASRLKDLTSSADVSCEPIGSHLEDIVIFATPYTEVGNIANEYDNFADKIVIDITNPVNFKTFELIPEPGESGSQEIATLIPEAKIIKAFNTTLAGTLETGKIDGQQLDVFIASDEDDAKKIVSELIKTSDMRPIDVGPLANARHLEGFGLIQMDVQDQIGTNWMSGLKFIG